jgi:transcriptional regulator with XRE-family HTH domain
MNRPSTQPFGVALRGLMDGRGLTYRGLSAATRSIDGTGVTHAYLNMLAMGHDKPSRRVMALIAQACGVEPTYFAAYRLPEAMRELDPAEVGLEQALANLNGTIAERRRARTGAPRPVPTRQSGPRPVG